MIKDEIYNSMKRTQFFTLYLHGEAKTGSADDGAVIRHGNAGAKMFQDSEGRYVVEVGDCKMAGMDDATISAITFPHRDPALRICY